MCAAAALAVGWKLGLRPEIRKAPEPVPHPSKVVLTESALRDSLEAALAGLGLDPLRIRKRELEGRPHHWEWAVDLPAELNLVRANLAITESAARWGASLWGAHEFKSLRTGGRSLRVEIGNDSTALGWLVLEGPAEVSTSPRAEPRLAIVIDDFGYTLDPVVLDFIEFPYPVTLAVLPGLAYSREIYDRAGAAGRDAILHLPMEPHGYPYEDPGPNAILVEMEKKEILEIFNENLACFPGVTGFSNHMGSVATEDVLVMRVVLTEAARRGLFFLDSLTTPRSVGARVAAECGVPCVTNDLFIDNRAQDLESIKNMIRRLARKARARGSAVGIGHTHETTLRALREVLPELVADGMRIVPVSDLATVRIARR